LGTGACGDDELACARDWVAKRYPAPDRPLGQGAPYRHDRIRVGYVSADFREHPVSYLIAGIFERHDRARLEVTGISIGPADPVLIPESHRGNYQEKVVWLPHSYLPHDAASRAISGRRFERHECGLPERGFVFCCFNNAYKLNPRLFALRMRILNAVEGSVLWLSRDNDTAVDNLRKEAAAAGVDPARLIFADRMASSSEHLARHCLADLFLDTLPYNA